MTKVPSQYKYQKHVWGLTSLCFALGIAYVSLIGLTMHNVVERQQAEKEIAATSVKISELEFTYLNRKSAINAEMARTLGFVESRDMLVAKKGVSVSRLGVNEI